MLKIECIIISVNGFNFTVLQISQQTNKKDLVRGATFLLKHCYIIKYMNNKLMDKRKNIIYLLSSSVRRLAVLVLTKCIQ